MHTISALHSSLQLHLHPSQLQAASPPPTLGLQVPQTDYHNDGMTSTGTMVYKLCLIFTHIK